MSDRLAALRRLCRQAVAERVVPGLVVAVGLAGRTPILEAFGSRRLEPTPAMAELDTVWDVASLTKAVVTSLLTAQAVGEGALALEDPLISGKMGATVRQALAHTAGLAAHRRFWEQLPSGSPRAAVVALAAAEPLVYAPGSRSLYSDLGFILLGDRLERALGARLDALASQRIFRPLGLASTGFVDGNAPDGAAWLQGLAVAATERCPVRGRLLEAEVHDLNAWAMGGIAGHAGLFSTAGDLAAVGHALCASWRAEGGIVPRDVLRAFWTPAGVPGSTWRLGWDGPALASSLAGARLSRASVGHLAFTGCSLWIDPERETFVLVLSNRVHPIVNDHPRWKALRPALNDAALDAVDYH